MSRRGWAGLLIAWITVGVGTGVRLQRSGGVFGEAVPLADSIVAQMAAATPWAFAVVVAWWASGRWPMRRDDILRPFTIQAWIGLGVVVAQQVLLAALRSTIVAPGLRPFDPWGVLVEEWVRRGPAALAVYGLIVLAVSLARSPGAGAQDVPGAGRGGGPS